MKNLKYLSPFLFLLLSFSDNNDIDFNKLLKLRIEVLLKNKIGKAFQYNLNCDKSCNKTTLTYLGIITTNKNKQYKILNSFFVSGYSCRGTSRICIYNLQNQYLGNYYMGMPENLPDAVKENCLVYNKENSECVSRKGTKISFKYGVPKQFFLDCYDHVSFGNQE